MCNDKDENELSFKEKQKLYRKEQYKKAKERFKNSDFAKELKEKKRLYRKLAYQKAKNYRLKSKLKINEPSDDRKIQCNTDDTISAVPVKKQIVLISSIEEKDVQQNTGRSKPKLKIV